MNDLNKKIKRQMVWGIVLLAIGVIGIFGAGGNGTAYVVMCLVFMAVGAFLLYLQTKNRKIANEQAATARNMEESRRRAEEARLKAAEARYNAEANKYEAAANAMKTCKSCGAVTRGNYCEYCGSKLE